MADNSMLTNNLCEFSEALASNAPVPGGGGASAMVGALGAALASMVCNLTTGKKKYAAYEGDIQRIVAEASELREQLLKEIDGDAEAFAPLAKAYSIPKDDPARGETMETALKSACDAPMRIMRLCCKAIELHSELAEKGSALAISDVGVGVLLCKSALIGASLNVIINVKSMTDRQYAANVTAEMNNMLDTYCEIADRVYKKVLVRIG